MPNAVARSVEPNSSAEGANGQGAGETIVISFPAPRTIAGLDLVNGYAKSDDMFAKNGRARSIAVTT